MIIIYANIMERQEINSEKLTNQCRTCLSNNFELKSIFELDVDKMIMACASVQIQMNDGRPQLICVECIDQVFSAYSFKILCEESDVALRQAVVKFEDKGVLLQAAVKAEAEDVLQQAVVKMEAEEQPSYYNDDEVKEESKRILYSTGEDEVNARCSNTQTIIDQSSIINVKNEYTVGSVDEASTSNYKSCGQELDVDGETQIKEPHKQYDNRYICCICKKESMNLRRRKEHLLHVHTSSEKCRVCKICHKEFPNSRSRKAHSRIHKGERPTVVKRHSCKICGKPFRLKCTLSDHMRIHPPGRPLYMCITCGETFTSAHDLPIHMQTHPEQQKYECSVCGKKVSRLWKFNAHVRRFHTDIKFNAVEHTTEPSS